MHRKGLGHPNVSGLDENPDYTCPDYAELPVFHSLFILWPSLAVLRHSGTYYHSI